jgi:flagellar motor protein MotB
MAEEGTSNDKKKKSSSEGGGVPPWITTYSDLITLMLAFFVILISFREGLKLSRENRL